MKIAFTNRALPKPGVPKPQVSTKKTSASQVFFAASAKLRHFDNGKGYRYEDVVVLDGARLPIGAHNGALREMNETDLAASAAKGLLEKSGIKAPQINDSLWGNVIQSSQKAPMVAHNVLVSVGGRTGATSTTFNKLCGSGLLAIEKGANDIGNLEDESQNYLVLAGGTESMTNAPYGSFKMMSKLIDAGVEAKKLMATPVVGPLLALKKMEEAKQDFRRAFKQDLEALTKGGDPESALEFMNVLRAGLGHDHEDLIRDTMADTAENLRERYLITPEELDEFSVLSNQRAGKAQKEGRFDDEIVPAVDRHGKVLLEKDELDRRGGLNSNTGSLGRLRSSQFKNIKKNGTTGFHNHPEKALHTAANSSRISDGAAAVILSNIETARRLHKAPLGEIVSIAEVGVNPHIMGLGAAEAAKRAIETSGVPFEKIDLIEVTEAFASVAISSVKEWANTYKMDEKEILRKTNVNGGAIALGHPLGATGARLVVGMLKELKRQNKEYGLVTMCIGGGQGIAAVLKNPAFVPGKGEV